MVDDASLEGHRGAKPQRFFERVADTIARWRFPQILERSRDAIEVRFPTSVEEGADLVVIITPEAMELRLPTIEWTGGAYGPVVSSVLWRRVLLDEVCDNRDGDAFAPALYGFLDALQREHELQLATCVRCNERFLPARMTGDACHGCAERFEGVVY